MNLERLFNLDSQGVPYCSKEKCPRWSLGFCDALQDYPSDVCEVEVRDIVKDLASARKTLSERTSELVKLRGRAQKAEQYETAIKFINNFTFEALK